MSNNPAVNKWISNNYDIIRATVPDSSVYILQSAASASGKSINAYIVSSVFDYLGLPVPATKARFDPTSASACVVCGNPLPEGKARYCSDDCKREGHRRSAVDSLRRKRATKQASRCVATDSPHRNQATKQASRCVTADNPHRNQSTKQASHCVICGALLPDGSKGFFCSDACKKQELEARRKRRAQFHFLED